jgi:hypothetical protein
MLLSTRFLAVLSFCHFTIALALLPYFRPELPLSLNRLQKIHQAKLALKIYVGHDLGDAGFTTKEFRFKGTHASICVYPNLTLARGTYGVSKNPNIIMLPKNWSFGHLAPAMEAADLDRVVANLGGAVDRGAVQALQMLLQQGWLRQVREWHLTEVFAARVLLNDHGWLVRQPDNASLVMLNGNTSSAERFLRWEQQQDSAHIKPRHFGVVPYGRSLSQGLLSEYRLKDANRSLVRYGRQKPGDVTVPFLTQVMPHGPRKLSDMSELYNKPRSWMLSFVGSSPPR